MDADTGKAKLTAVVANGNTLLRYALLVEPDPLQTGGPATLTLVVSNPGRHTVDCALIVLTIPVGTGGRQLVADAEGLETQLPEGWQVRQSAGSLGFQPESGHAAIGEDGLSFTVSRLTVNDEPGTARLGIDETATPAGGKEQVASATLDVPKFPTRFSLGALSADPLDVAAGGTTTLMWRGSAEAAGQRVGYEIEYQPADAGAPVVRQVGAAGPFRPQEPLTRSGGVTFTLTAKVPVAGQDAPLAVQRQVGVTVEAISLEALVEPSTVGVNGLVRLRWNAPNADHCLLDNATLLPPSGERYFVVTAERRFTVAAVAADGTLVRQEQPVVSVDPTIVATESGFTVTGATGPTGAYRQPGGRGGDGVLRGPLPPLETAGRRRVLPITVIGGTGGTGGAGRTVVPFEGPARILEQAGPGGPGGNAVVDITLDGKGEEPAHYIVAQVAGGPGGAGGPYPNLPGPRGPGGSPGGRSVTIDGNPVQLP